MLEGAKNKSKGTKNKKSPQRRNDVEEIFFVVISPGIEPGSTDSESIILSVKLRDHFLMKGIKK